MADPFEELNSLVKPGDSDNYGFGVPTSYGNRALQLESAAAKSEDNAMSYLRQALSKSAEVSPQQGLAATLLAAIPTLGGYMIGKHVGMPKIPEGVSIDYSKYNLGGAAGGAMGAALGEKSATGYLGGLDANKAQANDVYTKMAAIESQKAGRLQSNADSIVQAGLSQEEQNSRQTNQQAFERSMIPLREESQIRVANAKPNKDVEIERELQDPVKKAAFARLGSGTGTAADITTLSPQASQMAAQMLRSNAYQQSVGNTQGRWTTEQGYAEAPDTVAISPMGNDPKLNNKRSDIISARNMAKTAVQSLASSYDASTGAFTGLDRATEAALASQLYTAARGLASTGANLTKNEQPLVASLSAPQLDINGAYDYVHRYLMQGGDPAAITRTVGSVLDKAFNAQLEGTGRRFKEYDAAPSGGDIPNRSNYKTPEEYLEALKSFNSGK